MYKVLLIVTESSIIRTSCQC